MQVAAKDIYWFQLTSDDGSRMRLGSDVLIDNNGLHAALARTETVCLEAGWHPFTIEYFEATNAEALSLAISTDGTFAPIPATDLRHTP